MPIHFTPPYTGIETEFKVSTRRLIMAQLVDTHKAELSLRDKFARIHLIRHFGIPAYLVKCNKGQSIYTNYRDAFEYAWDALHTTPAKREWLAEWGIG